MKAKKSLGQHFLKDENIALKIVNSLSHQEKKTDCLEIGPGTGVLTKYLIKRDDLNLKLSEIDREAIEFLKKNLPSVSNLIIEGDILKLKFEDYFSSPLLVIGNIPYNITGPIFFKILDYRNIITESVLMIQKEVADRITASHGNKTYGILSVLLQLFFKVEKLFDVPPQSFIPPPKVNSTVVKLTKLKKTTEIDDYLKFKNFVKAAFNQRRKTLRNALKLYDTSTVDEETLKKRAEQLSPKDFEELYKKIK